MLLAKMERLVTSIEGTEEGAVSESVDEISASIVKVEQEIQTILDRQDSVADVNAFPALTALATPIAKPTDGCLTERNPMQTMNLVFGGKQPILSSERR